MRLEVHFHQQDEASVLLESATDTEDEPLGEILLSSLVGARMICNLGSSEQALALATMFSEANAQLFQQLDGDPDAPTLGPYQGSKGRRGFLVALEVTDDKSNFKVKSWGLGPLARGAGYYAPNAALLLVRYLIKRREGQGQYLTALCGALQTVGTAFRAGDLTLRSQAQIAMWATLEACRESGLLLEEASQDVGQPSQGLCPRCGAGVSFESPRCWDCGASLK